MNLSEQFMRLYLYFVESQSNRYTYKNINFEVYIEKNQENNKNNIMEYIFHILVQILDQIFGDTSENKDTILFIKNALEQIWIEKIVYEYLKAFHNMINIEKTRIILIKCDFDTFYSTKMIQNVYNDIAERIEMEGLKKGYIMIEPVFYLHLDKSFRLISQIEKLFMLPRLIENQKRLESFNANQNKLDTKNWRCIIKISNSNTDFEFFYDELYKKINVHGYSYDHFFQNIKDHISSIFDVNSKLFETKIICCKTFVSEYDSDEYDTLFDAEKTDRNKEKDKVQPKKKEKKKQKPKTNSKVPKNKKKEVSQTDEFVVDNTKNIQNNTTDNIGNEESQTHNYAEDKTENIENDLADNIGNEESQTHKFVEDNIENNQNGTTDNISNEEGQIHKFVEDKTENENDDFPNKIGNENTEINEKVQEIQELSNNSDNADVNTLPEVTGKDDESCTKECIDVKLGKAESKWKTKAKRKKTNLKKRLKKAEDEKKEIQKIEESIMTENKNVQSEMRMNQKTVGVCNIDTFDTKNDNKIVKHVNSAQNDNNKEHKNEIKKEENKNSTICNKIKECEFVDNELLKEQKQKKLQTNYLQSTDILTENATKSNVSDYEEITHEYMLKKSLGPEHEEINKILLATIQEVLNNTL